LHNTFDTIESKAIAYPWNYLIKIFLVVYAETVFSQSNK